MRSFQQECWMAVWNNSTNGVQEKTTESSVAVCAKKKHHCFIAPKGRKNKGCSCHSSRALASFYIYIHFLYSTEHSFTKELK